MLRKLLLVAGLAALADPMAAGFVLAIPATTDGSENATAPAAVGLEAQRVASTRATPQAAAQTDPRLGRARALFQQGRIALAAVEIEALLAERPGDGDALLLAGRIALAQGNLDAARSRLQRALDAGTTTPFMARYGLGMAAFVSHDHRTARQALDAALAGAPNLALARLARAQVSMFLGDLEAVRADLETLRSVEPFGTLAAVLLAELQLVAGRFDDAVATLQQAAAHERPAAALARSYLTTLGDRPEATLTGARRWLDAELAEPRAWFWNGFVTAAAGRPAEAAPLLQTALAIDDQHGPSYLALLTLQGTAQGSGAPGTGTGAGAGRQPGAVAAPESAVTTGATAGATSTQALLPAPFPELDALLRRMRAALDGNEPGAARAAAEEILSARPRHVPALLAVMGAAEAEGDLLAALDAAHRLDLLAPDLPQLLARLATLARRAGATELARSAVDRALAVAPEDGSLQYLRATVLESRGDLEEAIAASRRAIELGFATAPAYVTLGNLLYQRQDIAAAVDALARAVELDREAAEHIAAFALTALTTEDHARVRDLLEAHAASHPDDVNTLYALGTMYLRDGELQRARDIFEGLAALRPDHSQVHYNLAQIHRRLGDDESAARALARFEELKRREDEQWELHNQAHRRRQEGREALQSGDAGRAVAIFTELLAGPAAEPSDRLALARAHLAAGDAGAAYEEFRHVLRSPPYQAATLCDAARAAEAVGEAGEAQRLRDRAELLGGCSSQPGSFIPGRREVAEMPWWRATLSSPARRGRDVLGEVHRRPRIPEDARHHEQIGDCSRPGMNKPGSDTRSIIVKAGPRQRSRSAGESGT